MSLVLSLFPGIGLLDMAFEQEGFCIVRGPDILWGGDIHSFAAPAGKFNGLIGDYEIRVGECNGCLQEQDEADGFER